MNMHNTVSALQSLPAMPRTAREILAIELASDKGNDLLLKLIEKDLAISARIIGLANSPLFGTSRKIMTVGDAARVLGIKRVKMVALGFAMMSSVTRNPPGLLNVQHLWKHSMALAVAMDALARAMPRSMRPPDEDIYLAGLLHDIGFLVLDYVEPELSNRFHERRSGKDALPDAALEAEMLEMDHCELGALLASHWNLSGNIIEVLRKHHAVMESSLPLVLMTRLTENLLSTFGVNGHAEIDAAEWQALGISEERIEEVRAAMLERADEMAAS